MSQKEINAILQKQLASVTHVLPKDKEDTVSVENVEFEQIDIYYTVKPFYLILSLIGMQKVTFSYEKKIVSNRTKAYAMVLALAVLCVACYIVYERFLSTYPSMSPASVITDLLTIVPMTFSTIVSLLMAVTCNRSMILRTLNNFVIVDKQLAIQGMNIYKPLRTKISVVLFLVIVGTTLQYVYDYYFAKFDFDYAAKVFMIIVKELVILEIALLIYVDATRLDFMNGQLENTKYDNISKLFNDEVSVKSKKMESIMMKFSSQIGAVNYPKDSQDEEKIDDLIRLMRVYDRLADNANIVNSCFGIPLLCSAIAVFINILSTVDRLITMSNKPGSDSEELKVGSVITWCLRDLFFVSLVTIICERLQSKVKKTTDIINKLSISSRIDANKQELLERFSQLIACRKFTLTACNFFPFDFTFIYSLVGAVATYTVILLQVSQPPAKKP